MQRWGWPLLVVAVTALYGLIPLLGSEEFYLRGDSAAQFAPTWGHLGDLIRDGHWPPVLDPDNFAGGNYAAEGLFGVYNPVNALIFLWMSVVPNLIVGITTVKVATLCVLALGVYRLGRDYGATRPAAAAVAVALPFSGYTLYWDAGSWPSGLIAFAYFVWVWWAFRRCLTHRTGLLLTVVVGGLAVLQGNPYGTLGVVVIGVGLLLEGWVTGNRKGVVRLASAGLLVAAFLPLVYLPLMAASDLASRANLPFIENNGVMRPSLGDLIGFGAPTYLPDMRAIRGEMAVPAVYLCWFLVPLLPWLRFEPIKRRRRELTGALFVAVVFGLLSVGPSQLWLFRWPLRLIEYSWVGVGVLLAIALSAPLKTGHRRERALASLGLVGVLAWITLAEHPDRQRAGLLGAGILLLLTLVLFVVIHRGTQLRKLVPLVAIAGTGAVLLVQATQFNENESSRPWHVPASTGDLEDRFGDLEGRTMFFTDLRPLQEPGRDAELRAAWDHFLPGSMYEAAGVDAVNNYTGMGFRPFERKFCLHYEGFSRPCGYENVWKPLKAGRPILADLMKLDTIVVQRSYVGYAEPADGWSVAEDGPERVVYTRDQPLPYPDSRLAWAGDGVDVESARSDGLYADEVELSATGSGERRLVFAQLSWPGYSATLDGKEVDVDRNTAGLAVVDLPANAEGTLRLQYRTPGILPGAALGLLALVIAGVADLVTRRRRARANASATADAVPLED